MSVKYIGITASTKYNGKYHLELEVTPGSNNTATIKVFFCKRISYR